MFLIFGLLLLKMDFMYFVYFMCVEVVCTQGNMGEQPVAECFTLYKYIENKKKIKKNNNSDINAVVWQIYTYIGKHH